MVPPYERASERARARRLRPLVLDALARYDVDVRQVRLLSNATNGIFRVDTADGRKLVLRVANPVVLHTHDSTMAEAAWLVALHHDAGLRVPLPVPARDGSLVVTASAPGVPEPRDCVLFTWVPGVDLAERMSGRTLFGTGALLARLHAHAARYKTAAPRGVPVLDCPEYAEGPSVAADPAYEHPFLTRDLRDRALRTGDRVSAVIDRQWAAGDRAPHLLHGDIHPWNVKVCRGHVAAIDFEDLTWGFPVHDLGITLWYLRRGEDGDGNTAAIRAGYESVASAWPCPPDELEAVIATRAIVLLTYALRTAPVDDELRSFVARVDIALTSYLSGGPARPA
jgi:Ser/Thr protein kinase RdoA (MazF antagonist)